MIMKKCFQFAELGTNYKTEVLAGAIFYGMVPSSVVRIMFGFILYLVVMLAKGSGKEVNQFMYMVVGLFVIYFILRNA